MTIKISDGLANAMLDAIEIYGGTSCRFQVWDGAIPVDESTAPAGDMLVEMVLPTDWLLNAVAGVKQKNGTWSGAAVEAGVATFFRICNSAGVPFLQGSVTMPDADPIGDATLDNTNIAVAQVVSATSFSFTAPGL